MRPINNILIHSLNHDQDSGNQNSVVPQRQTSQETKNKAKTGQCVRNFLYCSIYCCTLHFLGPKVHFGIKISFYRYIFNFKVVFPTAKIKTINLIL